MDVPKGLEAGPHQRMMFWRPKNQVLKTWKCGCVSSFCACIRMLPKNPKFNYTVGKTSNNHNSLNINPNHAKFMFKLKPRMSTFQWNIGQMSFFSIIFKAIWALLSCDYFQTIILSCDYFQTIMNSLIILGWCMSSSSLGRETKGY